MNHGLRPIRKDKRDFSFPRTFGSVSPVNFPAEYNCDAGLAVQNQEQEWPLFNIPALPEGCTGYTSADLCTDEDGVLYNPKYTYDKTRYMEGTYGQNVGCDIRDALKSTIVYGVQAPDETTDGEAMQHRRTQYFNVSDITFLDDFDDIRNALWQSQLDRRSVSIGTPWLPEWSQVGADGIITDTFTYDGESSHYSWHNWKICGWKLIDGEPHLIGKTWQGRGFGDNGFVYFSRATINKVMAIPESAAFTLAQSHPNDVQTVRNSTIATILETIVIFLKREIALHA